jgi:ribose-phosphate pyrophosphokinase
MELLIMISACKGGSAKSITGKPYLHALIQKSTAHWRKAVMPYFPYSRQSKKKSHRGAIVARMLANLLSIAGCNHVITIDLHATQMQGFFKCPVDNLVAEPILAKWIKMNVTDWQQGVVVSKNPGGTKRVTSLADALKLSFGIVTTDRRRMNFMSGSQSLRESLIFDRLDLARAYDPEAEAHIIPAPTYDTEKPTEQPKQTPRGRNRATSNPYHRRMVNGNHDVPPSPLAKSTRPVSVSSSTSLEPSPDRAATFGRTSTIGSTDRSPDLKAQDDEEYTDEVSVLLPCS